MINSGKPDVTFINYSRAFVIFGFESEINNNIVRDNFWMQPVYAKGQGNTQNHNVCKNNQHSGVTMKSTNDGGLDISKENIQDGNIVTGQCDRRAAVRMFGSGRSINSIVKTTITAQADFFGGLAFQTTASDSEDGVLTVTGDFNCPKGINITTGGDIDIDVNLISQEAGVRLFEGGVEYGDVRITGKIESIEQALSVKTCETLDLSSLTIICDTSSEAPILVDVRGSMNTTGLNLTLTDKLSDGNPVSNPIQLFGKEGGDYSPVFNLDGITFRTDRNISRVFAFNADAGVDGLVKVSVSDAEIDLNGKTCTDLSRTFNNLKQVVYNNVRVDGTVSGRTINAGGLTIGKVLINQNLMDYIATDDLATHVSGTVTTSRVGDNKTA